MTLLHSAIVNTSNFKRISIHGVNTIASLSCMHFSFAFLSFLDSLLKFAEKNTIHESVWSNPEWNNSENNSRTGRCFGNERVKNVINENTQKGEIHADDRMSRMARRKSSSGFASAFLTQSCFFGSFSCTDDSGRGAFFSTLTGPDGFRAAFEPRDRTCIKTDRVYA